MKKKIAVYANGWSSEALSQAIEGMKRFAAREDFDVFVFLCFANVSVHKNLMQGELNVYKLCDAREYDGIISFSNMLNSDETVVALCREAKKLEIPIVNIGMEVEGIPTVSLDGNMGMRDLITHLVEKHGVKNVVYVGGVPGHAESDARMEIVKAVLEEHGSSLPQENVCYGGWSNRRTVEAIHSVMEKIGGLPDAFVCANDIMAMAAATELGKMGYDLPKDVIVTGFDHILNGQIFYPALTTVEQNYDEVGYQSCQIIYDYLKTGKLKMRHKVSTNLSIGESCRCGEKEENWKLRKDYCRHFYQQSTDAAFMEQTERSMRQKISDVKSYDELKKSLQSHFEENHTFEGPNLHIVLNAEYVKNPMINESDISGRKSRRMREVIVSLKDGRLQDIEAIDRHQLIPGYEKKEGERHVYYILPLHFYQSNYGYLVLADEPYILKEDLLYSYMEKLQQALKLLRTNLRLDLLNQNLTRLYDKDPMTGLFNRFGYENKAIPMYQESIKKHETMMVMFVDINHMKQINDRFGHIYGDAAIKAVSEAIDGNLLEGSIAVRFGGDEFLIIAPNCDGSEAARTKKRILDFLEKKNADGKRPYRISTSCGYVITDPDSGYPLQEYIREADRLMYEIKREVHEKDLLEEKDTL